jgi:hypothetical protein
MVLQGSYILQNRTPKLTPMPLFFCRQCVLESGRPHLAIPKIRSREPHCSRALSRTTAQISFGRRTVSPCRCTLGLGLGLRPSRVVTTPHSTRFWNCHVHVFDIPGIRFTLFFGRSLPGHVQLLCASSGPDQPILVSDAPHDILASDIAKLSKTTRLSRTLQRKGKWSWSL